MSTTETNAPELDRPYPITKSKQKQFATEGFIKIKNVLSAATLEQYGAAIDEQVFAFAKANKIPWGRRDTYQRAFIQVMNLWLKNDQVKRFVFSHRLAQIAATLLQSEGVRLYHDQALYKEPTPGDSGHTPWHVDQYYWPIDTEKTITAWIPLQAVPLDHGPMSFAAGSQNFEQGRGLDISDESENVLDKALTKSDFENVVEPFDLGEVSFHLGWTFHRAEPNHGDRVRRVMTVIYMADNARVIEPQNQHQTDDLAAWLPGLKPGDLAASHINPVLWKRSAS